MLCANGNLPRKGQVRTDPTTRIGHTHPPLFTQNTVVSLLFIHALGLHRPLALHHWLTPHLRLVGTWYM